MIYTKYVRIYMALLCMGIYVPLLAMSCNEKNELQRLNGVALDTVNMIHALQEFLTDVPAVTSENPTLGEKEAVPQRGGLFEQIRGGTKLKSTPSTPQVSKKESEQSEQAGAGGLLSTQNPVFQRAQQISAAMEEEDSGEWGQTEETPTKMSTSKPAEVSKSPEELKKQPSNPVRTEEPQKIQPQPPKPPIAPKPQIGPGKKPEVGPGKKPVKYKPSKPSKPQLKKQRVVEK